MKKVVFTFAVCICMVILSHAQKCEVVPFSTLDMMYPATEINLFDENRLILSKLPLLDPPVKNLSSDSNYVAYIAPSDSSIMVFLVDDRISFFKLCSSKDECNSYGHELYIGNLIIQEFNRLQPAGIFSGTAVEADSIIRHIIQVIKDMYTFNSPYEISMSGAVYNDKKVSGDRDEGGFSIPVSGFCRYNRNEKILDFCSLIDSVRQCGAVFQQESSTTLKPSVRRKTPPGTRYQAFDMNGNLIRSGTWHENSADEFRTPAIIRFENGVAFSLYPQKGR